MLCNKLEYVRASHDTWDLDSLIEISPKSRWPPKLLYEMTEKQQAQSES